MDTGVRLSATTKDYLEAIHCLCEWHGAARCGDIARVLGLHKSTVSLTLKSLAAQGLVARAGYGVVMPTGEGRKHALAAIDRHAVVRDFLALVLRVDATEAERTGRELAHCAGDAVIEKMREIVDMRRAGKIEEIATAAC